MAEQAKTVARPSRIWRIVLVVSLALNLAVVGVIAGAVVSGRFGDGPPRRIDFGLGPVARALTSEERREIGRELRPQRGALGDHDFRAQMAAMTAALRAEPYDGAMMQALMEDQAAHLAQMQASARRAVLDMIAAMTPERRRSFADQLEQEWQRRPARDTRSDD
ncbi:periplasmic heavy metal sensor [Yoonia sp.]|uniref:periplasmic heavy metal sensor n=1 Tax=Yoonia sp. TaxID=2212373 RepID=UPI00391AA514